MRYGLSHRRWTEWVDSRFTEDELERLASLPTQQNEYGYDPFGFNREEAKVAFWLCKLLYRHYFRAKSFGLEHLPAGRVMLVANHSGQLPFDAVNIVMAGLLDAPRPRIVRSMIDRWVPTLPYVGYLFTRWGQVLGTPENCRRLLDADEAILVFPEGVHGIAKSFSKRYQLQPFGLGFMRLALETGTPIVPVGVVGAEEQAPALNITPLAKLLGAPAFPVMPFPPFLPLVPLPSRYYLNFGEPLRFEGDADDEDEEIESLVSQVTAAIDGLLREGLRRRTSIYF
jgi:1-acyl-sn-glycerol-3-phosphate acyltransferase